MTRLLISVRDVGEAHAVLDIQGVDLLDVKQPSLGSLGRAEPQLVGAVIAAAAGRMPVSAACGELIDVGQHAGSDEDGPHDDRPHEDEPHNAGWHGAEFFKFGLARAASAYNWTDRWAKAIQSVRRASGSHPPRPVAVVYADWRAADAPRPDDVIEVGATLGCGAALLDTCGKSQGSVTDLWTTAQIAAFVAHAQHCGMLAVVGGSLTIDTIPLVARLQTDVVAIRGAACAADRTSQIDPDRVRQLVACLRDCRIQDVE
jgi:uncharacterized protein (UPF0264 family)